MILNKDRNQIQVGETYYTYYTEMSMTMKFRVHTGLIKIRCKSKDLEEFKETGDVLDICLDFEILDIKENKIHHYKLGGYILESNYYNSWDEAAEAHDREIIAYAEGHETRTKEKLYKKLILLDAPKKSDFEIEAIEWYEELTEREKEYVKWIKMYYSEV
jgi:hypothetical protein